jgi:hypothetical protein
MILRGNNGRTSSDFITESEERIFGIWRTPPTIGRAGNTRRHDKTCRRETRGAAVGARSGCSRRTTHSGDAGQRVGAGVSVRPATVRMAASRNVAGRNETLREKEQKPEGV